MVVEFWGVGTATAAPLSMTTANISSHLLADWLPSLPDTASSLLVGWPPVLIDVVPMAVGDCLTLRTEAGRTERQWKSILSWMLGVAGSRHVLEAEGYRWVAPLSAFYRESIQDVDLSRWNLSFPKSSITADYAENSRSRLRPDYIAIRPLPANEPNGQYEFALAESKGTRRDLTNMNACPTDWYNQARNASLTVNGSQVSVPRNLVVATRVNPNAVYPETRRLQVRAWNKADDSTRVPVPQDMVADIVAAHLFGFFKNLRLRETARAIALSVQVRAANRRHEDAASSMTAWDEAIHRSDDELQFKIKSSPGQVGNVAGIVILNTDLGDIEIAIARPTLSVVDHLCRAQRSDEVAAALKEAEEGLDRWTTERKHGSDQRGSIVLSLGAEITFPREAWGRP